VIDAVSKKVKLALDNMTTYDAVRDFYLEASVIDAESANQMITMLEAYVLEYTGESLYTDLTCIVNGEPTAITKQMIYSALLFLQTDDGTGAVQSPYYLYNAWCTQKGIN
jgi:hypothetical protein